MQKLEPYLTNNHKFLLGDKLFLADFVIGSFYCDVVTNPNNWGRAEFDAVLKKYPSFKQFGENFKMAINFYLKKRPDAPM